MKERTVTMLIITRNAGFLSLVMLFPEYADGCMIMVIAEIDQG